MKSDQVRREVNLPPNFTPLRPMVARYAQVTLGRTPVNDENTDLPDPIRILILAATRAERRATGSRRRAAFRTTRYLLAGAVANGVNIDLLAKLMEITPGSAKLRASSDGAISLTEFMDLLGAAPIALPITGLANDKTILATRVANEGEYQASELVHALLAQGGVGGVRPA